MRDEDERPPAARSAGEMDSCVREDEHTYAATAARPGKEGAPGARPEQSGRYTVAGIRQGLARGRSYETPSETTELDATDSNLCAELSADSVVRCADAGDVSLDRNALGSACTGVETPAHAAQPRIVPSNLEAETNELAPRLGGPTMPPGSLVRAALRGDGRAWEALLVLLRPVAFHAAFRMLRNDADADDVANDTMRIVCERLEALHEPEAVIAWTRRIAVNVMINRVRRQREVPCAESGVANLERALAPTFDVRRDVRRALAALPPEQREVVLLLYLEGASWEEIAAHQQVPVDTARSRLRLALIRLRRLLGDDGDD